MRATSADIYRTRKRKSVRTGIYLLQCIVKPAKAAIPTNGSHPSRGLVFLVAVCLLIGCLLRVEAQQATAQLTGTVRDVSGAVVVGAKVTLKNIETNVARAMTSDRDGDYLFTLVPIGSYELSVEQQGFNKYLRRGITLQINQNARLDVTLEVGTTSQIIEVTGDVT